MNALGSAVVTGAGGVIGKQIATELAATGRVIAVIDVDESAAQATVQTIESTGGTAVAAGVDIRDGAAVEAVAADLIATLGPPSVIVNCAGWDEPARFEDTDVTLWRKIIDINLLGTLIVTHAFLEALKSAPGPRAIVNIASDAGRVGSSNEAVYSGAKAGIIGLSKALAREIARYGITVNCVAPGPTDSPMLANMDPKVRDAMVKGIPLRRVGTAGDVAGAVVYFASPAASYVTGQVLSVSGGLTMVG